MNDPNIHALSDTQNGLIFRGAPARAKRASDRAPYSWNIVNLFSFGCHVTDRAHARTYVRTYASTDCTGRVGETIKRKGGVSQACLGKSTSLIYDFNIGHSQYGQLTAVKTG